MSKFLVFNTEAEAWTRADEEGRLSNFPYFQGTGATRYRTEPLQTVTGKWAINVEEFEHLTEDDVIRTDVVIQGQAEAEAEETINPNND